MLHNATPQVLYMDWMVLPKMFFRLEEVVRFPIRLKYSGYQFWHIFIFFLCFHRCYAPLLGLLLVLLVVSLFYIGSCSNLPVTVSVVIQYNQLCLAKYVLFLEKSC